MIVDMPDTTTSDVAKELVKLREEGGVVTLGRVLTLVISTHIGNEEEAIEAANDASREHPMRIIVVSKPRPGDPSAKKHLGKVDGQIRVGGDAGASEVVVLRAFGHAALDEESLVTGLLLPDAPVVAWWPGLAPEVPSKSPLGRIATRRITDAATQADPLEALKHAATAYRPGDTDFAWTRVTLWRTQLAAILDQPPFEPVAAIEVSGSSDSPSTLLLAAWLGLKLQVPASHHSSTEVTGIHGVTMSRPSGDISLRRDARDVATLEQPSQPTHTLALPRRSLRDCLAEELRRLDPDEIYGEVITAGLRLLEG
ncbi:glucose-6-phosphate dehydrogenase assembly protein OpcA [Gryllotalpicola sp.]|uniref:glucose-6-phosphate dehydrogenase assembly protein OpcA n=1 Tax=Gryllotalpicola sp. TaxID=1932787 RepID=UPI00262DFFC6|nr:glucose-6-phosphate dehydrogenase assembly protein OpcA [Gryllotalpicola sp.]